MVYKALDIANKILAQTSRSTYDEPISNLKLQKLLYYMQGFHIACFGEPLFDEDIEAWLYGPVVPCIYEQFKSNGNKGIEYSGGVITLSGKEEALFNEVYRVYGAYSAIGLMNMTHEEMPWKSTETGQGNIISKDKLRIFFKKRLK
ncbi:hypothetical protein EZS27_033616 [termite gut metagenome]|uniref:Antitoxin SocA-like Panacea domain-containing protein n=1 Tax=termite gut metagenome TaxID=433724 RepID=A0A5J4Q284_9ZZZZ